MAQRFGLVAVAAELATHYGVTGWDEGEATQAAGRCFASWLDSFGGAGNREDRVLLAHVRGFFETHGASRFEDVGASIDQRVINRAGFYRTGMEGTREFLVLPEAFKRDVCAGFDQKAATQCLLAQGWILPDAERGSISQPSCKLLKMRGDTGDIGDTSNDAGLGVPKSQSEVGTNGDKEAPASDLLVQVPAICPHMSPLVPRR